MNAAAVSTARFSGEQYTASAPDKTGFPFRPSACALPFAVRLQFQRPPFTQAKLVRCVRGCVLDVAVDIRRGSPTFGQHVAVELSEENHRQFFIPKGFAHGFAVLSETAVFQYKCDEFYHPEADAGILLSDPALGIDWRVPMDGAVLSDKDRRHPLLADADLPDFGPVPGNPNLSQL